ncbi:NAD(P)-dependent oxidoreductase [Actinoplanes sp. NPDC049596]|uniref:NAD(P)-dependent oxidoreductase n=1 Tax=unclassified Actinoplanes TaxID=2626549 RepID=UPI003447D814
MTAGPPDPDAPRICVYHPTMGPGLAEQIRSADPGAVVEVVAATGFDPPDPHRIDVLIANTFPPGMLARCSRLKWLHLTGTGTDHVAAGLPRPSVRVSTSARVPVVPVAEFALMGLLVLAKDAVALVDSQRERRWRMPDAQLVGGSRLLLLGLGRIGTEIARRAQAFGMSVTAVTHRPRPASPAGPTLPSHRLAEAAARADHLVVAVPSTPQTAGLVSAAVLDALPAHACVINVGRADVVDTAALVHRLRSGRLRAALLDVHAREPLYQHDELWDVPNLWITPHCAYRFPGEQGRVGEVFLENLADFRAGRPLRDQVDLGLRGPAAVPPARAGSTA